MWGRGKADERRMEWDGSRTNTITNSPNGSGSGSGRDLHALQQLYISTTLTTTLYLI